jgi:hypothetical protein
MPRGRPDPHLAETIDQERFSLAGHHFATIETAAIRLNSRSYANMIQGRLTIAKP